MELDNFDAACVLGYVLGEFPGHVRLPSPRRPVEDELPLVSQELDGVFEPCRVQEQLVGQACESDCGGFVSGRHGLATSTGTALVPTGPPSSSRFGVTRRSIHRGEIILLEGPDPGLSGLVYPTGITHTWGRLDQPEKSKMIVSGRLAVASS